MNSRVGDANARAKTLPALPGSLMAGAVGHVAPKSSEIQTLLPTPVATRFASAARAGSGLNGMPTTGCVIVSQPRFTLDAQLSWVLPPFVERTMLPLEKTRIWSGLAQLITQ